jgi:large subunit ribosomal protein L24
MQLHKPHNIRKGDNVKILTGKDRGKQGKVIEVLPKVDRVVVEGLNMTKKHMKPSQKSPQGGIVDKAMSLDISNVMVVDPKSGLPTRIGKKKMKVGKSTKERWVRVAKRSGEVLEAAGA